MNFLLKKLEIFGFKSFADKTILDLSYGIIAVVGPNGSGKSNIIDSIRWLLGERDARSLRGSKVEDLIFAGSSKKPRQGLARATLYFDNKNKFFPLDFSEITIGRETRRDGSNYYYLNNSEVRLKDLVDFLAKARLGTQGMIIISQGNSDIFIKSLPVERREMIEETLGLREYRLKKIEAERKLKNTKINLEKVEALIEEILPHLRSLRRQTNRWQKREELEKELQNSLKVFFGSSYFKNQNELEQINEQIKNHLKQKDIILKQKEDAEKYLKQIENKRPEEQKELKEIRLKIRQLNDQRNNLQKEINKLEINLENFIKNSNEDSLNKEILLNFVFKIKSKLENLLNIENLDNLKNNIQEIILDIQNLIIAPKNNKNTSNLEKELETIKNQLNQIDDQIKNLIEQEKKLETNEESFYEEFKKAIQALRTEEDKYEEWERTYQNLNFSKEKIEIKFQEWEHQVVQFGCNADYFKNIKDLNDFSLNLSKEQIDELERKILRLQGELAAIGEIDEALLNEARQTEERYELLSRELNDLKQASVDLESLIKELNSKIEIEFKKAFTQINNEFDKFFKIMFGGGSAKLKLIEIQKRTSNLNNENGDLREDNDNLAKEENQEKETGIDIELKLPMKKLTSLDVLSGGERSLVSIAALFAIISISPPPFLVVDEIDAMLDEKNAHRFAQLLKEYSSKTQFIVVTHNRSVMEVADVIYGVTLGEDETSKIVSLKLEQSGESKT
jgi:chromosome segregation protein